MTYSPFDDDGDSCEQTPSRNFHFPFLSAVRFVFASGQQSFLSRPSFERCWLEKATIAPIESALPERSHRKPWKGGSEAQVARVKETLSPTNGPIRNQSF